ncbi:MAG TPA: hypothetical protein ENG63_01685 [Candidatus Desulfofervidus auxilii]|uniref:Uncharacterized protein n=1 Tax=Desulfofervidus auxilii TaxID=1621989 RepID=A0A7C0Y3Q1_DESA2|nr:hypothetical protein [Candidatus Desulfofervidus auxilii]
MKNKIKRVILFCLLILSSAFTLFALDPVVVSFIDWTKTGSFFGETGYWSFYSLEAEVQNFMKTGIVHVIFQAIDPSGNVVGTGEIAGYLEYGQRKKIKGRVKIFGDPRISKWKLFKAYVE